MSPPGLASFLRVEVLLYSTIERKGGGEGGVYSAVAVITTMCSVPEFTGQDLALKKSLQNDD